ECSVDKRMRHPCRREYVLFHQRGIALARGALDRAANHAVTIRAVSVLRARLELQRVVGKDPKPVGSFGEMPRAVHLIAAVVANARCMGEQLAGGDGPFLLRERWAVPLQDRKSVV